MNSRNWLVAMLAGISLLLVLTWIFLLMVRSPPFPQEIMLPDAPKTARDIEAFRSLRGTMTMADVVRKCGLPDELQGSGIYIFVYRLRDGSTVRIGTWSLKSLFYVQHIDNSGKDTQLMPKIRD